MDEDKKQTEDILDESDVAKPEEALQGNEIPEGHEECKEKWLRATADYQNLQKEVVKQRSVWAKMSKIDVLNEFIPVYENFKKAFSMEIRVAEEKDGAIQAWENWKKGIEYIMKQFEEILRRNGVVEIKTVGEQFDPVRHEALGEEESAEYASGTIIREVEGGYTSDDQILRPAKVIIAS